MRRSKDNKHQFALFYKELSSWKNKHSVQIYDDLLIHRIITVLRLKPGDTLELFDRQQHTLGILDSLGKKACTFTVRKWQENVPLRPDITLLLPLLKRDALDDALYFSCALGANKIQLMSTEKGRTWSGAKEYERLQRVVHAAAEQSKHFAFPLIEQPCTLQETLKKYTDVSCKIFADTTGKPLLEVFNACLNQSFLLCVGPEGDLTKNEKDLMRREMEFCRLTPTVLRSEHALMVLLGAVRSLC
jgi:RsmE family RNA methyltransferase